MIKLNFESDSITYCVDLENMQNQVPEKHKNNMNTNVK